MGQNHLTALTPFLWPPRLLFKKRDVSLVFKPFRHPFFSTCLLVTIAEQYTPTQQFLNFWSPDPFTILKIIEDFKQLSYALHVQLAEEKFLGNCLAGIKLNTIASVKTEVRASRKTNSDS